MYKRLTLMIGGSLYLTHKNKSHPHYNSNKNLFNISQQHFKSLYKSLNMSKLALSKIAMCDNGPFLGCSIRSIDKDQGMIILIINSGGPAQKSGLKQGDIILQIDGMRIKTITDYKSAIGMEKQKLRSFKIKRDQQEIQVKVEM